MMSIDTRVTDSAVYHILPTAHKGYITGSCLVTAGALYADYEDRLLTEMLTESLSMGTKSKTEAVFNEELESSGIRISLMPIYGYIAVKFTCLKQDFAKAARLINEQLVEPRLDKEDVESLKERYRAQLKAAKHSTSYQANAVFTQQIYPEKHFFKLELPTKPLLDLVDETTNKRLRDFHQSFDLMHQVKWVVVGDVSPDEVVSELEQYAQRTGAIPNVKRAQLDALPLKSVVKRVTVKDKQSVDVRIGHSLPINQHHPDYLPLKLAIDALGGSFSARLMRTVRDEDGLTYNVGSMLSNFYHEQEGYWCIYGSFSPKLLDQGIASIERQLKLWLSKGITQEELEERKKGMIGKYQVMLSDPSVLAGRIVSNIENGFEEAHLYTYPEKVEQVTLEQVNAAIQKYIQGEKLIHVYAGSIDS